MEKHYENTKKYYDPEYDRIVEEFVIQNQYEWFKKQKWFHKDYETFKKENFEEIDEEKEIDNYELQRALGIQKS